MSARLGGMLLAVVGVLFVLAGASLLAFTIVSGLGHPGRRGVIEHSFDVPARGNGRVSFPVKSGSRYEMTLYATLDGPYREHEKLGLRLPVEIHVLGADRALQSTFRDEWNDGMYGPDGNPNLVLGLGRSSVGFYDARATEKVTIETAVGGVSPPHVKVTNAKLVVWAPGLTKLDIVSWSSIGLGVVLFVGGLVLRRRASTT